MKLRCKTCNSKLVPIVYGLPGADLFRKAQRGKVILGGCLISPDNPRYACPQCCEEESD